MHHELSETAQQQFLKLVSERVSVQQSFPRKQVPSSFRAQAFSVAIQANCSDCKVPVGLFCCTVILFNSLITLGQDRAQLVVSAKGHVLPRNSS